MSVKHIIDRELNYLTLDLIIEGLNEIISNGNFTTPYCTVARSSTATIFSRMVLGEQVPISTSCNGVTAHQ